jgi:nicotinamide riboside kinase
MSAPTVDAAINELMDWAWHAVYELLAARGLLGEGLDVAEYTGMSSWVEGSVRYTVVHSLSVAILFIDTDPVDATTFHRDLLGSEDPKAFFSAEAIAR